MAFLAKIRNYIKRYRNKDFRTSIRKEKQEKYLIPKSTKKPSRWKWGLFQKKDTRSSPFSRFVQDKISTIGNVAESRQKYLGYIGIFLISASLYIVAYSSYFDITPSKVLIEGSDGIDISIAYRTIEDFYGRSLFLLNEEDIAYSLKKYQKNIAHITIDRLYPNGLKIIMESYPIAFILHVPGTEGKEWWVSENGIVIPRSKIPNVQKTVLEYISSNNKEDDTIFDYKEIMDSTTTNAIGKIVHYINENWWELKIQSLQYFANENELHISFENNTKILLTLKNFSKDVSIPGENDFLKNEMLNLKTFIDNRKDETIKGAFWYIDARVPGKIFICRDIAACRKNLFSVYGDYYK